MHEGVANGAFGGLAEIGARHQDGVHIDSVRVETEALPGGLLIVDGHQQQIDIGLRPDGIVREAAAQNRGQNGGIALHLLDKCGEGDVELILDFGGCPRSRRSFDMHPILTIILRAAVRGPRIVAAGSQAGQGCMAVFNLRSRPTCLKDAEPLPAYGRWTGEGAGPQAWAPAPLLREESAEHPP